MRLKFFPNNLGFAALVRRSLESGNPLSSQMILNYSGQCENPFEIHYGNLKPGTVRIVIIKTRCRKCTPCLEFKRKQWFKRAQYEMTRYSKAWFVTFTYKPSERLLRTYEAQSFENLGCSPGQEKFYSLDKGLLKACGKDLTKYFKRLRKKYGKEIRYLFVFERHKDGFPHIHGLIFSEDLKKSQVEEAWQCGFTNVKLVRDDVAIGYVTKYLSKDAQGRVRASLRFGQPLS